MQFAQRAQRVSCKTRVFCKTFVSCETQASARERPTGTERPLDCGNEVTLVIVLEHENSVAFAALIYPNYDVPRRAGHLFGPRRHV